MKINKKSFEKWVLEEAISVLREDKKKTSNPKKVIAESREFNKKEEKQEVISPDQILQIAEEIKKLNQSLDFRKPLISDEDFLFESSLESSIQEKNRWKMLMEFRIPNDEER